MEYVRTFTEEFETGNEAELSIENRSGTVTIRGGDTRQVRLEVVARLWAENDIEADEQADLIHRGISHEGRRVTIRAPSLLRPHPLFFFGRGPRVDYQLTVPRRTNGRLINRSGRIEAEDLIGRLEIESRSGRVALREIDGEVRITSSSGGVQAEAITGPVSVESRSGGLRLSGCKANVEAQARSGMLQIENIAGDLKLESRSGSVSVSNVGRAVTIKARSGSVRYEGPVGGDFEIEVMSGSVRLALDANSVFKLDAEAMSGSVHSDFPLRSSPPGVAADRVPTMRIRAMSGSVYIGPR